MPSENPFIGNETGIPSLFVQTSGLPSALAAEPDTTTMFTSPTNNSGVNAAGTSENIALHLAVLIAICLVGIFVFRQSNVRFAFSGGVGR